MLTEEQRGAIVDRLYDALASMIVAALPADVDEADLTGVGVTACVGVAMAFAANKCGDAPAAVELIHCVAESAAADIYGAAA